ncbi:50S ribosomal protein L22 [Patescibacteria group bacterium]
METVKAICKHIRLSPRKLRLATKRLVGLSLNEALDIVGDLPLKGKTAILAALKQGCGNALNNGGFKRESLRVKEIQVGEGPVLKRWQAVSRGRARSIKKRTSHLKIILQGELIKVKEKQNGTKS